MLEFRNISLKYQSPEGETLALSGVDLDIKKGEFVALLGPSGCGKSTLLSLAAGLLFPDSGQVLLEGEKVTGPDVRVGYMLQSDHLFPWLTIWQNVLLGLKVRSAITQEAQAHTKQLLCDCGLSDFADSFPDRLSGGMRQRAALVRTLACDPELLLLDEAFSALDYQTRLAVSSDVHRIIKSRGKTALLVTHDIIEAVSMADRIFVFTRRPGRIKAEHKIDLPPDPMARRTMSETGRLFDILWKELDVHV